MYKLFGKKNSKKAELEQLRERARRTQELENDTIAKFNNKERRIKDMHDDISRVDKQLAVLYTYQTDLSLFQDPHKLFTMNTRIDNLEKEKSRLEDMLDKLTRY